MPPKRIRKADPEEIKQQFETWKQSDEFKILEKVAITYKQKLQDNNLKLTSISRDFPGDWQGFLDNFWDLIKLLKVKTGKLKAIEQCQVRSFFFVREDREKEQDIIDGIHCGVSKDQDGQAFFCRIKFCDILENLKDQLESLNDESFQNYKRDLTKRLQEFIKCFQVYVKQSHKLVYEQYMQTVLKPIKDLVDINYSYRSQFICNLNEDGKEVKDFVFKAIEHKYIKALQETCRILYKESKKPYKQSENLKERKETPISCCLDIKKIFAKLNLKNWKNNIAEKMYLLPQQLAFKNLSKTLWKMWYLSINHWKIPLAENIDLVDHIQLLINSDIIAEKLLGNDLKRDQFNFIYNIVKLIDESDQLIRSNLRKKDKNTIQKSLPKLIVFKAIQQIRNFNERKVKDQKDQEQIKILLQEQQKKKQEEEEKLASNSPQKSQTTQNFYNKTEFSQASQEEKSKYQQSQTKKSEQKKKKIEEDTEEQKELKQLRILEQKYGRLWVLEGLIDDGYKKKFLELSETLKNINLAVQQDIDDFLIQQGMRPDVGRGTDESKEATKYEREKSEQEYNDIETIHSRPPFLWNNPYILQKHIFRSIADPKLCYKNDEINRVEILLQEIDKIAEHLQKQNKDAWDFFVDRVIDVFTEKYNSELTGIYLQEFHIYDK